MGCFCYTSMIYVCILGMVGIKNGANVFVRNILVIVIGGLSFWFFGYAFSFGPNHGTEISKSISGNNYYLAIFNHTDGYDYAHYVFQLSFAVKANSIVSGKTNSVELWILKGWELHKWNMTGHFQPINYSIRLTFTPFLDHKSTILTYWFTN